MCDVPVMIIVRWINTQGQGDEHTRCVEEMYNIRDKNSRNIKQKS